MSASAATVVEDTVPAAWQRIADMIRKSEDASVANLLVHVALPTRDLPDSLKGRASHIRQWATELQSMTSERLPFTHGQRLRSWSKKPRANYPSTRIDQIGEFVVPMLIRNPRTKRAVCFVGHPGEDTNISDEPIPALELIQFRLDNDSLDCTAYFRAQEMYFFWLVNMFELITLQEYVCQSITRRMPDLKCRPGSITTIAFTAYMNVSDLEAAKDDEHSPTLAIERLKFSSMRTSDFNRLLTAALIRGESDSIDTLIEILLSDSRKLDRVRDLNLNGMRRLRAFLEENQAKVSPVFRTLPRVANSTLSSLVNLNMYLEKDRPPAELRESIREAHECYASLLHTLKQANNPRT